MRFASMSALGVGLVFLTLGCAPNGAIDMAAIDTAPAPMAFEVVEEAMVMAPKETTTASTPQMVYSEALADWRAGRVEAAAERIAAYRANHLDDQRLALFQAACQRSGLAPDDAPGLFYAIYKADPTTIEGRCALSMIYLDTHKQVDNWHFPALRRLVRENPDDLVIRWLLAMECENYSLQFETCDPEARRAFAREGLDHYSELIKRSGNSAPESVAIALSSIMKYLEREQPLETADITVAMFEVERF